MKNVTAKARNQAFKDMRVKQCDYRDLDAIIKSRNRIQEPTENAIIESEINKIASK